MIRRLALAVVTSASLGALAAADLCRADPAAAARSAAFQRLTGGLGTGPALDPSSCPAALDPRIEPACPDLSEPLPGLGTACPWLGRTTLPRTR